MIKNYTLLICKELNRLPQSQSVSALEIMRRIPDLMDIPGYRVSKILREMGEEGYVQQSKDGIKMKYSLTAKGEEYIYICVQNEYTAQKTELQRMERDQSWRKEMQPQNKIIRNDIKWMAFWAVLCIVCIYAAANLIDDGSYFPGGLFIFVALYPIFFLWIFYHSISKQIREKREIEQKHEEELQQLREQVLTLEDNLKAIKEGKR